MMRRSKPRRFLLASVAISAAFFLILNSPLFADDTNDEILIHNRHQLSAQPSPCHWIALGEPDDTIRLNGHFLNNLPLSWKPSGLQF